MIAARLMGGLGNQMFQYAAALRLAEARGAKLKLDLSWLQREGQTIESIRTYELGCFALRAKPLPFYRTPPRGHSSGARAYRKLAPWLPRLYSERDEFSFDPEVLNLPDNSLLVGVWQSPKYFEDAAQAVRADFQFKTPPEGRNAKVLGDIKAADSVSVHVRRGDYVTAPEASKFHGLAPIEYYQAAVAKIATKVKSPHFFIFSDDPKWCQQNLKIAHDATYIDHNPPDKGFEDLRLMSACQHHITANSSFSWWGAWLNPDPDKTVIAPKRWFSDSTLKTADRFPAGWIRL